jgi:hypothetical protein
MVSEESEESIEHQI